jgi:hypothetical protein
MIEIYINDRYTPLSGASAAGAVTLKNENSVNMLLSTDAVTTVATVAAGSSISYSTIYKYVKLVSGTGYVTLTTYPIPVSTKAGNLGVADSMTPTTVSDELVTTPGYVDKIAGTAYQDKGVAVSDLNNYISAGSYSSSGTLANSPQTGEGTLDVIVADGVVIQTLIQVSGIVTWRRRSTDINLTTGVNTFTPWLKVSSAAGVSSFSADGCSYENILSFVSGGFYRYEIITTNIPKDSYTMPTVFLQGYSYGLSSPIDIQISLYNYGVPAGNIFNSGWVSKGGATPVAIKGGYTDTGMLQFEIDWGSEVYLNRYRISAYIDGIAGHIGSWFTGWTSATAQFPVTTGNIITVPRQNLAAAVQAATPVNLTDPLKLNVTQTNTYGRTFMWYVSVENFSLRLPVSVLVNDVVVHQGDLNVDSIKISTIVPVGATYRINTTATLVKWVEQLL